MESVLQGSCQAFSSTNNCIVLVVMKSCVMPFTSEIVSPVQDTQFQIFLCKIQKKIAAEEKERS